MQLPDRCMIWDHLTFCQFFSVCEAGMRERLKVLRGVISHYKRWRVLLNPINHTSVAASAVFTPLLSRHFLYGGKLLIVTEYWFIMKEVPGLNIEDLQHKFYNSDRIPRASNANCPVIRSSSTDCSATNSNAHSLANKFHTFLVLV